MPGPHTGTPRKTEPRGPSQLPGANPGRTFLPWASHLMFEGVNGPPPPPPLVAEGKLDDANIQEPNVLLFKSLSPRVWGPGDLAGESPCVSAANRTPSSPT